VHHVLCVSIEIKLGWAAASLCWVWPDRWSCGTCHRVHQSNAWCWQGILRLAGLRSVIYV